jgi:membrane-associated protease RseP (regulator of RpoE activity)
MKSLKSALVAVVVAAVPAVAQPSSDEPQHPTQGQDQSERQPQGDPWAESGSDTTSPDQQMSDTFEYSQASGPRLGLLVTGLTPELRAHMGAPNDRGVLVARVAPRSPAARAGIHVGDVLLSVHGQNVSQAEDVLTALSNLGSGQSIPVVVVRDHKQLTLQAQLQSSEPGGSASGAQKT